MCGLMRLMSITFTGPVAARAVGELASVDAFASGDLDHNGRAEVVIDYGVNGLWTWDVMVGWLQLHGANFTLPVTGDFQVGAPGGMPWPRAKPTRYSKATSQPGPFWAVHTSATGTPIPSGTPRLVVGWRRATPAARVRLAFLRGAPGRSAQAD